MRDADVWTDLQPAQSGNQPTRSDLAEHVTRAFARKFDVIRVLGPLFRFVGSIHQLFVMELESAMASNMREASPADGRCKFGSSLSDTGGEMTIVRSCSGQGIDDVSGVIQPLGFLSDGLIALPSLVSIVQKPTSVQEARVLQEPTFRRPHNPPPVHPPSP